MSNSKFSISVPAAPRNKLRHGVTAVVFFAILGGLIFLAAIALAMVQGQSVGTAYQKGLLIAYMLIAGCIALSLIFIPQRIVYSSFASSIASVPEIANQGSGELAHKIKERFSKSGFLYASGKVPSTMRRIRVSPVPNMDGTFWMMTTDEVLSTLTFEKYRTGEIPEPNDPDSLEARFPPEVRKNATFFGQRL